MILYNIIYIKYNIHDIPVTGWNHFQTNSSATQNRYLIQNDVKFQWSVFIFVNRGFGAFVLTKFPLSLFNTILSIPDYRHISFQLFFFFFLLFYHIIVRIFNGESFGVKPVETGMAFLCVFSWSRRWPGTFDVLVLVLYLSASDFLFCCTVIYWPA